jgi:hypothetical protein
MAFWRNRNW